MKKSIFLFLIFIYAFKGFSCSCFSGLPLFWSYNETEHIFKGKVMDVVYLDIPRKKIKFQILFTYKGSYESDTIWISTAANGSACGLYASMNETWVIFANNYHTSLCSQNLFLLDSLGNKPDYYDEHIQPKYQKLVSIANLKDQYVKEYNSQKQIVAEGIFKNQRAEGLWKYNFDSLYIHPFENKVYYKNGLRDSVAFAYYRDGKVWSEYWYQSGKRNGPFKWYFQNGSIKEIGNYLSDKKHGEFKEYYESGNLKEISFYENGVSVKETVVFSKTGDTSFFYKYNKGEIIEYKSWYKEGFLKTWEINFYSGDTLKKERKEFYPDGKLKKLEYLVGYQKNGPVFEFYENGILKTRKYFLNGKESGIWYYYNENGELLREEKK